MNDSKKSKTFIVIIEASSQNTFSVTYYCEQTTNLQTILEV